jgi:hypothetical protein
MFNTVFFGLLCFLTLIGVSWGSMEIQLPKEYIMSDVLNRQVVYSKKATQIEQYKRGWGEGHRAQYKEDLYLYERYFYGMVNGTIMESGALDGSKLSTTYMFEKFFGWFPIHVEASFQHFAKLKENRPNGLNIHAALCNESRILHFLHRANGSAVDGIIEFMEKRFITRFHKYWWRTRDPRLLKEMQCVTVPYLLKLLHVKHIDIWVLDVEGAELPVLSVIDWNNFITIDIILLEVMRRNDRSKFADTTIEMLEKVGYKCHPYMSNAVCVHNRMDAKKSAKPGIEKDDKPKSLYHGT